ncbi:MAG: FecR domain-containing protein [Opitutae bacterium]|nr:FecR domain-containing protein [Opitutae bacterium]
MNPSPTDNSADQQRIAQAAADWVLRNDRGLTPGEQDEFTQWLAADPRHGEQLARLRRHWQRLDQLAQWRPEHSTRPNPDLLAPPLSLRLQRWAPVALALAAAAAVVLAFIVGSRHPAATPSAAASGATTTAAAAATAFENQQVLADGSLVELKRGAVVTAQFTAGERRVKLERGEAFFTVAKDRNRPFLVTAGGVTVRALGTAFNLRVDTEVVEVLVTEGRVQVNAPPTPAAPAAPAMAVEPPLIPQLEARQRAIVSLRPQAAPPQIATLTVGEIERVLAWQHRLLDFTAAPLDEIVAEFNRRNTVQLVVQDPALAAIRISATFRSDNVDGFVSLLEAGFGVRAERNGDAVIRLRAAR